MLVQGILDAKGAGVISVQPSTPIAEAARLLKQHGIGAVIVVEASGELCGILSERDLARGLAERGPEFLNAYVGQWMTKEPVTCTPDDPVEQLMRTMTTGRFRHLPVLSGDEVVGIVSIGDVVKHRLQQLHAESRDLREYITREGVGEQTWSPKL